MSMDVGGAGRGEVKSDINVTPLVDVMLVLLIIMMIVAPMLQKGVDLATVSSYLGHTTIAMTEAYVQAEREHKHIAGEILGSMYQPPASSCRNSSQVKSEIA